MDLSQIFIGRPDILADEKKLKSTFSDFYANDISKVNRMMKAYEIGVLEALVAGGVSDLEKKKLIDRLVTLHDMQEIKAKEAINEWVSICNKKVLEEYKKYIQEKKQNEIVQKKEKINSQNETYQEQKEKKLQQEIIEKEAAELNVEADDYEKYINIHCENVMGGEAKGIPCGVGKNDYGFIIHGVPENKSGDRVISLVYNFLTRNSKITKESYPEYLKVNFFNHELNYGNIYRYIMILLDLVVPKKEMKLSLNILDDEEEVLIASNILNEYLAVFSRLIKEPLCSITIVNDASGRSISVTKKADIYIENLKEDSGLRRRFRYSSRVNYALDESDRNDLEFILHEISNFKSFKRGQFSALCSMLNANSHAVCIMPTGSGKSLIYYMASILQPQPVLVISPTDILIKDQIRNLKKFHNFDSVTHMQLRQNTVFTFFKPATNLLFSTPATFQNRNLFEAFKGWNIAYVVLDEVHCISNWGHDFRPEYLMLSRYMKRFLGSARYLGFTATANYTVAQDVQEQLEIPLEHFYSPILFEKYNVKYDFRELDDETLMYEEVKKIATDIVNRGERGIVFTKSDEISRKVADAIGYEADVFLKDDTQAYQQFVDGYCSVLVANEDLGIGINLPNVNCTVHFGIPLSKNEYVQEIGRAGREDEKVTSYVVYLNPSESNVNPQLLNRDTQIDRLPQLIGKQNNDYAEVYKKINCGADTSDVLYDRLLDIYSDLHSAQKTVYKIAYSRKVIEENKKLIYMLFVTGYVKDWYTYWYDEKSDEIELMIDVCSVPFSGRSVVAISDDQMLGRMINISRDYFASMGNDRESIFKVSKATKIEDILKIYVDWYYRKYLYHHKEEFLDVFEFLISNKECNALRITEEIEDYFTLPFVQIKEDEIFYSRKTISELSELLISGIGKNTLANLERIIVNRYSYKLDFLIFIGNWNRNGRFETSRLERFWQHLSDEEKQICEDTIITTYLNCSSEARWNCLKYLDDKNNVTGLSLAKVVDRVYRDNPKDMIYFGILSRCANKKFDNFMRR